MGVTIKDVARLAGVSSTAVSRVLNDYPDISPPTRLKVIEAMKKLDYRPHALARGLAKSKAHTLGILIPQSAGFIFSDPYFPELLRGVGDAASSLGFDILLATPRTEKEFESAYAALSDGRKADGLIVIDQRLGDQYMYRMAHKGFPFVLIGEAPDVNILTVDCNFEDGIRRGFKHLVMMGHRRIGFITGPWERMSATRQRWTYQDILAAHEIPYTAELVVEGDYLQSGGYTGMKKLLDLAHPPTAVLAGNDLMALGVIRAVQEQGLKVPDDIAVVGVNDVPIAEYMSPPLTTVRQPISEMGTAAAKMVVAAINGQTIKERRIIFPTSLIIRESCGYRQRQKA